MTLRSIPPHLREHWPRWLLVAAVAVHIAMMGSLFWGYLDPIFSDSAIHPKGVDFFSVYEGGRNALHHRSIYLFDASDTSATPYHFAYRYIPSFAYAFAAPMNAIPAWPAYWAWVSLYEFMLVLCAYMTWRIADRGTWSLVGASMWFVFTPFYVEQYLGQFSFIMAALLSWTAIGVLYGRERLAGPPWVASLLVKTASVVLVPLFARLFWWRSLLVGAALVGVSLLYFAWYPHEIHNFVEGNITSALHNTGGRFYYYHPGEQGGVSLLRNSYLAFNKTASGIPTVYPVLLVTAIVATSLAATFLARDGDRLTLFSIWICVYFLCYAAWEHHYVMLLPALALLVALRPAARPWALAVFVLVALPTPYWLLDHLWNTGPLPEATAPVSHQAVWPAWGVVLHHAAKPIPVLVLWGYLVVTQLRQGFDVTWVGDLLEPMRGRAARV